MLPNDEPAFPRNYDADGHNGMSLRDWFAGKAIAIAWDAYDKGYCGTEDASERSVDLIAEFAYQISDAMLAAREARP